ncbi:SDR family NAD(P)-dependent oxidoreductase [Rhizobium mesosinicum]|uniref:SDR family oxidoreductase n=1 Tax=Rhizobium mesosinicum TaxID=335017 RepID=A0ABS7GM68_9HYPH|nr:SDR family oxidoreductase [Rhizobium mesosinicum]MBW9051078.1 SDR family oxidoreductase [Rhizobium mesosinicum]
MSAENKVAIITGASQGIGASIVKAYRDRGYSIVANSRNIKQSADNNIVAVDGNIGDRSVAERVVKTAVDRFGRVDTLINNAGIFIAKNFTDYTIEDYKNVLDVNLSGFFYVTQFAAAEMLKRSSGHIVQITTTLVDQPISGVPSVLASLTKGGLDAATRSLAIEYASKGIRVNAVSPGIIKTPMHPAENHGFLSNLHPVGRMGEVEEIAHAVLYLEDAGFVTGETLHVDGGQHAGRW